MKGDAVVIRNHLKTVLANCKKVGIVAVEINAGQFSDSCNLSTQQIGMVCDVLNEFSSQILQHVGGGSGAGRNMRVQIELNSNKVKQGML